MLTFDEVLHEYRVGDRRVPSVTQILAAGGAYPPQVIGAHAAARRGSDVHAALQFLDENDLDPDSVPDDLKGYLAAYEKFRQEQAYEIVAIERRVFHPTLWYAGTVDRVYKVDGRLWLVDLKTGARMKADRLQTAAYTLAWEQQWGRIEQRWCVRLQKNGKYSMEEHADRREDERVWLALLSWIAWRDA